MSFDDFFEGKVQPTLTVESGDMVIVDLSNLLFRAIYGSNDFKTLDSVNVEMIRHMTFNILGRYRKIFSKERYPEFVLAFDGGNLWRSEIFPQYKMNRRIVDPKKTQKERDLDEAVFSAFGSIKTELLESSPFTVVLSRGAEADDVIAVLCQDRHERGARTSIVSGDKDMRQLLRLPTVNLWSPNEGASGGFVKLDSPEDFLYNLIFKGDSGDGVPAIRSDDHFLYPIKIRQPPIYSTEIEEWKKHVNLHDPLGTPCEFFSDEKIHSNYIRNRKLVDLWWIPSEVKESIIKVYEADRSALPKRKMKFYKYLGSNGLNKHLSNIQHFV